MNSNIIQISQISVEDFLGMVEAKINQALQSNSYAQAEKSNDKEFYTRTETAKLLGVSLTTLFLWNRQGILTHTKIGSRVYYPKAEVQSKLNIAS